MQLLFDFRSSFVAGLPYIRATALCGSITSLLPDTKRANLSSLKNSPSLWRLISLILTPPSGLLAPLVQPSLSINTLVVPAPCEASWLYRV